MRGSLQVPPASTYSQGAEGGGGGERGRCACVPCLCFDRLRHSRVRLRFRHEPVTGTAAHSTCQCSCLCCRCRAATGLHLCRLVSTQRTQAALLGFKSRCGLAERPSLPGCFVVPYLRARPGQVPHICKQPTLGRGRPMTRRGFLVYSQTIFTYTRPAAGWSV